MKQSIILLLLVMSVAHSGRSYQEPQDIDKDWICPTILVDCPENKSDRHIQFKAIFNAGVPATKVSFKWTVSGGKIISGQGTDAIFVKSRRRHKQKVIATVEVLGIPRVCPNKASCFTVALN